MDEQFWKTELLAKRLRKHLGQLVHVNVIPLNPTPGSMWDVSPKSVEREFVRLVNAGEWRARYENRWRRWAVRVRRVSAGAFSVHGICLLRSTLRTALRGSLAIGEPKISAQQLVEPSPKVSGLALVGGFGGGEQGESQQAAALA